MGAVRWGDTGDASPHFFRPWRSPQFLFRFRNILDSHQAAPLTFYNKIALMSEVHRIRMLVTFNLQ